ncbi:MAG: hypothetical protein QOJ03_290 [Frankiaceae bacterium]|nr:hypothetical protein [Frankiaceae bacterium]
MPADRTEQWEVPLKESARDPDQVRVALTEWLRPRLGAGPLVLTRPEVPRDNGVSNETYLFEARGRRARYALVARVQTDDPL